MGIKLQKKWLATLDNRTRHEHRLLDGQTCPNGKKFRVEGMEIEYPGDPTAPGRLVYNCRCTLIADIEGVDGTVKNRHNRLNGKSYEQWKYELKNNNSGVKTLQNGGKNGIITTDRNKIGIQFFANRGIQKQPSKSLRKSINNWKKQIIEHQEYISDPRSHDTAWDEKTKAHQEGLIKHWKHEIQTFNQNIKDAEEELRKRGDI